MIRRIDNDSVEITFHWFQWRWAKTVASFKHGRIIHVQRGPVRIFIIEGAYV